MTNYGAIRNLTNEQLEIFLDQVFLTGLNTGYHSVVNPDIHDGNPFDADWLSMDVEDHPGLIQDNTGEELLIGPLVKVVNRIVEFNAESIPDDIIWSMQIVLPKSREGEVA